jgi:5-methylcytosine-specific restriction endonuclease McrA
MTSATICRCGTLVAKGEHHTCAATEEQKRRDNQRRNARPLTKARQTPQWHRLAATIRRRDRNTCQHCGQHGRIVDHINGDPHDHRPANLQVLCARCSGKKDGGRRYARQD